MNELYTRSFEEFLISGLVVHRKWFGWRNDKLDCWTDYVNPNNFFIDTNMRDFRGWNCILIYYPGHLASAVCFNEQVGGDYISLGGKRYVVCDGTYIGAPVGMTMRDMDNKTATVILLE